MLHFAISQMTLDVHCCRSAKMKYAINNGTIATIFCRKNVVLHPISTPAKKGYSIRYATANVTLYTPLKTVSTKTSKKLIYNTL